MAKLLQSGDKCEYLYGGEWKRGVIHGVRTYEDSNGIIKALSYLVDTGKDFHVSEHNYNPRDIEINKRLDKAAPKNDEQYFKALAKIQAATDLPKDELLVQKVRQPEQVELPQEFVKPL